MRRQRHYFASQRGALQPAPQPHRATSRMLLTQLGAHISRTPGYSGVLLALWRDPPPFVGSSNAMYV